MFWFGVRMSLCKSQSVIWLNFGISSIGLCRTCRTSFTQWVKHCCYMITTEYSVFWHRHPDISFPIQGSHPCPAVDSMLVPQEDSWYGAGLSKVSPSHTWPAYTFTRCCMIDVYRYICSQIRSLLGSIIFCSNHKIGRDLGVHASSHRQLPL